MRLRQALALLLAAVFALLPVSAALAESDYQEGDGWVYENGVFTITENGGWEQATEFGLPRNYAPNRKGFESLDNIQTVIIGKEVTEPFGLYGYYISWYDSPETVRIEEGNTCFAIENGWVVNTWTHTLICAEHPRESRETAAVIDNLPEDIRSIGACAFWDYEKLEEIVIPEKVTVIEFCAFAGCISLTHMVLPENLHTIGESAFADAALETCNWPSKLEILELGAFGHTNLTTVDLSNTRIRSVPGWCFSACEELEWIKLPEALVIIDGSAFLYCRGLKTVVIDASGVIVEGDAFERCNGLTNMVFLREGPYLLGINEFRIDGPQHWLGDSGETPTPAFYYTEAYQEDWAPNGETQWYEYDIRPIAQEGIEALLTMEPAEAAATTGVPTASPELAETPTPEPVETPTPTPDATTTPMPTAKPTVEPTATPAAEQAGRGTGAWVMVLLAAVGVLAVTVTILGIRLYGKGRK